MNDPARIEVLRGGAVGDFVLTLPALAALRARWPAAHLELVAHPRVAGLARMGGGVDGVTSIEAAAIARLFSDRPALSNDQAAHIRSFDVIVSYLYDPDGVVVRHLQMAGARRVIGVDPRPTNRHAVDHLLAPLAALGIEPAGGEAPRLLLDRESIRRGRLRLSAWGDRVAVLHPGSGSAAKNWPLERFLAVADTLRDRRGVVSVLSLGEADGAVAAQLAALGNPCPVLPPAPLHELAETLAAACGYVGNDSGITHLAAAAGAPVVALFGPSDPALWAPRGPRVRVIASTDRRAPGLRDIGVDTVCRALDTLLDEPPRQ